ncbi:thioredoxin-like protein [Entophlyctis helioformis]|nr:thioredoxin-like protein [Entophlyctis helioformis]
MSAAAKSAIKKTFNVSIVSDIACPWCYIGKRRFDTAIETFKANGHQDVEFVINYQPYELHPSLDKVGVPKMKLLTDKIGPQFPRMAAHTEDTAKSVGLHLTHDGMTSTTFDAHRLIYLAEKTGIQEKVAWQLFLAYHDKALNIGDDDVLADCFAAGGGDRATALAFLKSTEGVDVVRQREADVRRRGVRSVPNFSIDGQEIGGGQEPYVFVKLFERLLAGSN